MGAVIRLACCVINVTQDELAKYENTPKELTTSDGLRWRLCTFLPLSMLLSETSAQLYAM